MAEQEVLMPRGERDGVIDARHDPVLARSVDRISGRPANERDVCVPGQPRHAASE
jgi:hypothetical protein